MAKKTPATATEVPKGFTVANAEGSFGAIHDFLKESICTGKIVKIEKGVKTQYGKQDVMTVKTEAGDRNVWSSSQLSGLFKNARIGKSVWIRFDGEKKLKGRKTLKLFTAAIK